MAKFTIKKEVINNAPADVKSATAAVAYLFQSGAITAADWADPNRQAVINDAADTIVAANVTARGGSQLRQSTVAAMVAGCDNPRGITVSEASATLAEAGVEVKDASVRQHLNKLTNSGAVRSVPLPPWERSSGRGRPTACYVPHNGALLSAIAAGDLTVTDDDFLPETTRRAIRDGNAETIAMVSAMTLPAPAAPPAGSGDE